MKRYIDFLFVSIPPEYRKFLDEYASFIDELRRRVEGSEELSGKYSVSLAYLKSRSPGNAERAKLNAFYAFLVYRGYVSAYKIMKSKLVAGAESLYTWLRIYREVMGQSPRGESPAEA
ncbi:hypothetical protein [Thermofilum pendens]